MQLRTARLCLDCEEIHDQLSCPVCSSESFAYITRWIPRTESTTRQRTPASHETADTYRELIDPAPPTSDKRRWAKRGAVGVALGAIGLASWVWRQSAPTGAQARPENLKGGDTSVKGVTNKHPAQL
jgi:hypothetical protein